MAQPAGDRGSGPRVLPEVELKWSEFVYSLEKLRHKPYCNRMSERDWFRINPLEIVLLGAKSLTSTETTKKEHGTMVLVMKSLLQEMVVRPRFWIRLLQVLLNTVEAQDIPSSILQMCLTTLMEVWKSLEALPEFFPSVCAWMMTHCDMAAILYRVLSQQAISLGPLLSEVQAFVSSLEVVMSSSAELVDEITNDSRWEWLSLICAEEDVAPEISLQMSLILRLKDNGGDFSGLSQSNMKQIVSVVKDWTHHGNHRPLSAFLSIVQLLTVRRRRMEVGRIEDGELVSADKTEVTVEFTPEENGEKENGKKEEGDQETVGRDEISSVDALFDALTSSIHLWQSHDHSSSSCDSLEQSHDQVHSCDASEKLLRLIWIMLSRNDLSTSLSEAILFLRQAFPQLVTYSREGYLSTVPEAFLCEILEYVSSLVEHGTSPMEALHTNLPNLFGPAFGLHHHQVSCRLLQYGYLAVCSQHKKTLLTEGLDFLFKVFRLFPPIDEVKAKRKAAKLREEAVRASRVVIDGLIASLPLGDEEEAEQDVERFDDSTSDIDQGQDVEASESFDVSDEERMADKNMRQRILLGLLELACAMIRNGDNISYLFASCLPKLLVVRTDQEEPGPSRSDQKLSKFFGETPPSSKKGIPWIVDLKKLAVQVLELGVLCLENTSITPFQLCGIVVPKLVTNLDTMELPDKDKFSLTLEVLAVTKDTIKAGHNVEHLTSYGIDLLSMLLPSSSSISDLKTFISQLASHFVTSSHGSLLYLIKSACNFMLASFKDEADEIRQLFQALLFKGKRDEIRGLFRICKDNLCEEQYGGLRRHLYGYSSSKMNHRQFTALCELMVSAMDLAGSNKSATREVVSNMEEEDEAVLKEKKRIEALVLDRLTSPCMADLEAALNENRFKRDVWEGVASQLSRISLFRTLFLEEFHLYQDCSNMELLSVFQSKFPEEILCNEDIMQLLSLSTTRIEHMQLPRYSSLKKLLSGVLQYFLTSDSSTSSTAHAPTPVTSSVATLRVAPTGVSEASPGPQEGVSSGNGAGAGPGSSPLEVRVKLLQQHLDQFPRNKDDREKLLSSGYRSSLWEQRVSIMVQTDGSLSLEENLRQNLLACFSEFADILKQMAVTHVSVDGEMVKVVDLFTDDLSLTSLKGRRAIAVRMIDQCRGGSVQGHFYERKAALLTKEDQIEAEFEAMAKAAIKPKTFTVVLNVNFFDCARCCGPKIIGCYVPNGEHCERPLEIGMRTDSAIASIYDEEGKEIENAELLFTEEGVFFFKAYTNGHPYDTSQVWLQFFSLLLDQEESGSSLVPALIIPKGYPNQRTWEALRRIQSTELTGSLLTCRLDFSPEWRTYYDYRPERVRIGTDMILHSGFKLNSDQSRPTFHRQVSRFTKDLAGVMFEEIFQNLLSDDWLKQFRFLGKIISQYISSCVSEGEGDVGILIQGFNYDRWKKTYSRARQPPPLPTTLVVMDNSAIPPKENICQHLARYLDNGIMEWCRSADLVQMCSSRYKQLLELKCFLEKAGGRFQQPAQLKELKCVLSGAVKLVPILSLPDSLQEELMHWIFHNEDRVWRYRGGRSGHETLQQFMNFLGQSTQDVGASAATKKTTPYAGVAIFFLPELSQGNMDFDPAKLQVRQMISYATGETVTGETEEEAGAEGGGEERMTSEHTRLKLARQMYYEVVTAWVDPRFRRMNFSWTMYSSVFEQAPARLVMFDVVQGSLERIIASSRLLRVLDTLGLKKISIHSRQQSYKVLTQVGDQEQFEQVVVYTRPLRLALRIHKMVLLAREHPKTTAAIVMATIGLPATVAVTLGLFKK